MPIHINYVYIEATAQSDNLLLLLSPHTTIGLWGKWLNDAKYKIDDNGSRW